MNKIRYFIAFMAFASVLHAAQIGGVVSPDGKPMQCPLPGELQRRNTESKGLGLCVFTSIHHSAIWQNVPALQEFPKWVRDKGIEGGSDPQKTDKLIKAICEDRGVAVPDYVQIEGQDIDLLILACKSGRMPSVTYGLSPTGRYNGSRVNHMVNLTHADGVQFAILDNNSIGENAYEWMNKEEFTRTYTANTMNTNKGWAVILLAPRPPKPPRN